MAKIGCKDVYDTYVRLVVHAESISWSRFNNFLLANSIFLLAWTTLFSSRQPSPSPARFVMALICVLGILSGFAWAELGKRGRKYLEDYMGKMNAIESETDYNDWWETTGVNLNSDANKKIRPFQVKQDGPQYGRSYFLLRFGPYFFVGLHVILFIVSLA